MIIDVDYNSNRIIGFDGSRAFQEGRTGTENYSYQLLKALARLPDGQAKIDENNRYIVYIRPGIKTGSDWPSNFSAKGGPSPKDYHPMDEASGWQFKIINWPRFWTQGGLALQTFKDNLDVLFVPAHTLPLVRKPGLKTVVTVHDLGSEYLPSMHQAKQRLYLGFMQKYQLKTATKLIAVSSATKDDLIKRVGIDSGKIKIIYEGYDKNLFKPVKSDILVAGLKQYELQPQNYFLFVGTVQPRKNLARLIQAFAKFRDKYHVSSIKGKNKEPLIHNTDRITLAIAGSKGWMSDEIYALPKKLGIEKEVKFLGYVPDKGLPVLYSGATAFVFPSLFEGFGLPILEAQACGCPVLTSNISSMPEVAGIDGAVFVDPYSVNDIVKGMEKVQSSKFKVQSIKAGFENIKRFSWEKCARETLDLLEEI